MTLPSDATAAMEMEEGTSSSFQPGVPNTARPRWLQRCLPQEWPLDCACILVALAVMGGTNSLTPRQGFISTAVLADAAFPLHPDTVPSWSVPVIALLVPALVMLAAQLYCRRPWRELYRLLVALLACVLVTTAVTNLVKAAIGRPRPYFMEACWPNGAQVWLSQSSYGGYAACSGIAKSVHEARRSFPSGHSSWTASGLGFLTLYALGQLRAFTGPGHAWRLMLGLLPALGAIAVGVSRIVNYKHHPSDVWVGLSLGYLMAFASYRQLYPSLTHDQCDVPMYSHRKST